MIILVFFLLKGGLNYKQWFKPAQQTLSSHKVGDFNLAYFSSSRANLR
jgi:hypothetical protein